MKRFVPTVLKTRARRALSELRASAVADARTQLALRYLRGDGIEIGALQGALPVPRSTRVRYVDRLTIDGLREHYPELRDLPLDRARHRRRRRGARLHPGRVARLHRGQPFRRALRESIGTIRNHLQKLRESGVLSLMVPDMRATFDALREPTAIDHLVRDDAEGPERSRRRHYAEWVRALSASTRSKPTRRSIGCWRSATASTSTSGHRPRS